MSRRQDGKSSNIIFKVIVFLVLGFVLVLGGRYFLDNNSKKTTTKKSEAQVSTVKEETKQLQVALDAMKQLFVDGDHTKYRKDITDKEFNHVNDEIKKLETSDVKTSLEKKLEEIKKFQTQQSSTSYD